MGSFFTVVFQRFRIKGSENKAEVFSSYRFI